MFPCIFNQYIINIKPRSFKDLNQAEWIQNWTSGGALYLDFWLTDRAGMISGLCGIHHTSVIKSYEGRLLHFQGQTSRIWRMIGLQTASRLWDCLKHTGKHTSSSSLLCGDTNNLGFLHRRSLPFSPRPPEPDAFQAHARLWDVVCSLCQMTTQCALS